MSAPEVAADQLKCLRVLSVILADGSLTMPDSWHIHTFPGYEPPLTPTLEGLFNPLQTPAVADLHVLLDAFADRFGLKVEEKPYGQGGRVGLHTTGKWQGIELHVWGPAVPEASP